MIIILDGRIMKIHVTIEVYNKFRSNSIINTNINIEIFLHCILLRIALLMIFTTRVLKANKRVT